MKFKKPIEVQAGISDGDPTNPLGQAGYLLSSDGSNVNWVSPGGLSAETAEAIVQPIKANEALAKGDPVYIVGFNNGQNTNIVAKADSSDPTKMPVVGLVDDDYASQAFGTMTAFGSFNGAFDTTGGTENWAIGDIIFVKPGGGLTNIKPVGTDLIQNVAIVSRVNSQTGELEVIALGRTNDVPNLPTGRLFVGTAANTSLASDVVYVDDANDRVGIGTTNPSTDLEVSSTGVNGVDISQSASNASQSGRLFFTTNTASEGFALFNSNGTFQVNSGGIPNNTSGTNRISIIGSSGNVGIGTTTPDSKLNIEGTKNTAILTLGNTTSGSTWVVGDRVGGIDFYSADGSGGGVGVKASISYEDATGGSGSSQAMVFRTGGNTSGTNNVERMRLQYNGNVGINTTTPGSKLTVNGEIDARAGDGYRINGKPWAAESSNLLRLGDWDGEGFSTSIFDENSIETFKVKDQGVIINCDRNSSTSFGLDAGLVVGGSKFSTWGPGVLTLLNNNPSSTGADSTGVIQFAVRDDNSTAAGYTSASIQGSILSSAGSGNSGGGILDFLTAPPTTGSSLQTRMRINQAGNVGIGTTSPSAKLDVYGNLRLGTTGTFTISQSPFSTTAFYVGAGNGSTITFGAPASNTQNVSIQGDLWSYQGSIGTKVSGSFNNKITYNGDNYLNSGNLGIGTTSPNAKLDVVQATTANGAAALHLIGPNTNPGFTSSVLIIEQGDGKKITIDGNDIDVSSGDLFINDYSREDVTFGGQIKVKGLGSPVGDSYISNGNFGIGTTGPRARLHVDGGVKLGNDTDSPASPKAGTFRYYTSGNNSYVDMCMQTGASTYAWVNIVTNSW